jgi:hypothetical protein
MAAMDQISTHAIRPLNTAVERLPNTKVSSKIKPIYGAIP